MLNKILAVLICSTFALPAIGLEEKKAIIMRHGQSEHNITDTYNADPSHPNYKVSHLTEAGKQQVMEAAEKLKKNGYNNDNIALVLVSPMPRTQETAQLLVEMGLISQDKITIETRLEENKFGELEGKPIIRPWDHSLDEKYGCESDAAINSRIFSLYEEITTKELDGHILLVTHGTPATRLSELITKEKKIKLNPSEAIVLPLHKDKN